MANNLTPFQEKKIKHVFTMLYDRNGDGYIEKQDFELLLVKISDILDWKKGSAKYEKARETLDLVWEGLKTVADDNDDAKISEAEWFKMWGKCLEDVAKDNFPLWQKKYMDLMFDVNDKSGDDCIDEGEYTTFMSSFDVSESDCRSAFARIAGEGRMISRDQFATLWKVYLTSNDTSLPGNSLFGPIRD